MAQTMNFDLHIDCIDSKPCKHFKEKQSGICIRCYDVMLKMMDWILKLYSNLLIKSVCSKNEFGHYFSQDVILSTWTSTS